MIFKKERSFQILIPLFNSDESIFIFVYFTASYSGTVGVVHMINNITDAQWMVTNGEAGPYVAVVSTALFPGIVEILMGNPLNVAGVLLYDNDTMP